MKYDQAGEYEIEYTATDDCGNETSEVKEVLVAREIEAGDNITLSQEDNKVKVSADLSDYYNKTEVDDIAKAIEDKETILALGGISGTALGEFLASKLTKLGMVGAGTFFNATDITFPFTGSNGTRAYIAFRATDYIKVEAYSFTTSDACTAVYKVSEAKWAVAPVRYLTTKDL